MVISTVSISQTFCEFEVLLLFPIISYILPFLSYFELLSPVLDAFEIDAQVAIILYSLTSSLSLLNNMLESLTSSLFSSSRRSTESDKSDALKATTKELARDFKVTSSRSSVFFKVT